MDVVQKFTDVMKSREITKDIAGAEIVLRFLKRMCINMLLHV